MRRVAVLSPYAGDVERNLRYARAALADSLARGEAPYASHLLYPQVLDDADPQQRQAGLLVARRWIAASHLVAVYDDLGVSEGMEGEMAYATLLGTEVERRQIGGEWT